MRSWLVLLLACDLPLPEVQAQAVKADSGTPAAASSTSSEAGGPAPPFCSTKPGAFFCDDFERTDALGAWPGQNLDKGSIKIVAGVLEASGRDGHTYLAGAELTPRSVHRITGDVRVDALPNGRDVAPFTWHVADPDGYWANARIINHDGVLTASIEAADGALKKDLTKTFAIGDWKHISFEVVSGTRVMTVTVDGEAVSLDARDATPKGIQYFAGALSSPPGGTTVSIDNLFVEIQ